MWNERGQALVMVLLFSLVGSLFVAMVLYLVIRGTEMSGMQKRFQTALDAGHAGVAVEARFLEQGVFFSMDSPIFDGGTVSVNPSPGTCFYEKVFMEYPWPTCSAAETSLNARESPDFTYMVNGVNNDYAVYSKIVDTRRGLTATRPPGVEEPAGVAYGGEIAGLEISEQAYVYYTVELMAEDTAKGEVARISFDYAW